MQYGTNTIDFNRMHRFYDRYVLCILKVSSKMFCDLEMCWDYEENYVLINDHHKIRQLKKGTFCAAHSLNGICVDITSLHFYPFERTGINMASNKMQSWTTNAEITTKMNDQKVFFPIFPITFDRLVWKSKVMSCLLML